MMRIKEVHGHCAPKQNGIAVMMITVLTIMLGMIIIQPAKQILLDKSILTNRGCMTCLAMSWSGWKMVGMGITMMRLMTGVHELIKGSSTVWFAAAAGTLVRRTASRLSVLAPIPASTAPTWAFAFPSRFP